jgi:hypothetical protein
MPKKRAQITRETADDMYEDVIDRVTAAVDGEAVKRSRQARKKAPEPPPLVKVTVYMSAEDVLAIDDLVSHEFRTTGKRPRRSTVVCRAIQALHERKREAEGRK